MAKKKITLKNFKYDPSIDYQSEYELLPIEIKDLALSDEYVTEDYDTSADLSAKLLNEVEKKGWTFDYNFMGEIYSLRPIGEPEQEFSKGGAIREGGHWVYKGKYLHKRVGSQSTQWGIWDDQYATEEYAIGFNTKKEAMEFIDKNVVDYAEGGEIGKSEFSDGIGNTAFDSVEKELEGKYKDYASVGEQVERGMHEYTNKWYAEGGEMPKGWRISNGIKPTDDGYKRVYEVWKNGSADRVFDTSKEARDYVEKESKSGSTYAEGGEIKRGIFKGYKQTKRGVLIPLQKAPIGFGVQETPKASVLIGLEFNKSDITLTNVDFDIVLIKGMVCALITQKGKRRLKVNIENGNYTLDDVIFQLKKGTENYFNTYAEGGDIGGWETNPNGTHYNLEKGGSIKSSWFKGELSFLNW